MMLIAPVLRAVWQETNGLEETARAGGFAMLEAASKEDAIEYCKKFLTVAGDGTCEIRQVLEFGPPPS